MRKRILAPASMLLCMSMFSFAETPSGLYALVEAALSNDPNRLKAVEILRAAEAEADAERSRRLLDGALSASVGREIGIGSADTEGNTYECGVSASSLLPAGAKLSVGSSYGYSMKNDTANFSAGIKIPVFVNGRIVDPRLEAAAKATSIDLPLETARETADAQENSTVDAVIRLALDAAAANRASALAARHAIIAERDAEIARVKRDQGTLSYADLAKIEKDANEARLATLESRFTRDKKIQALGAASGLNEQDIDLTAIVTPECSLDQTLRQEPVVTQEMRRTARERKIAEMNLVLSGTEAAPTVEISTATALPGPVSRDQKTYDPDNKGTWNVKTAVMIPLPAGFGSARKKAADARLSAARHGEASAVRASTDDLNDLQNAWTTAIARVKLREQLLEEARARLRDVQSAHATQTATKLDVDRAELTVADAVSDLENDRTANFKAALDLYAYCGFDPLALLKEVQS